MRFTSLTLSILSVAALSGCTVHTYRTRGTVSGSANVRAEATYVTAGEAPPPLKPAVQVRPARPQASAVWVSGHWSWRGNGWVWVDGRWDTPPSNGYVWEPPVVVAVAGGGYQYHRGYWRRQDQRPPAVYRTDGTIRVHVRREDRPAPASRVVVRAGEPPPSRVVARPADDRGRSSTVTVRTRPADQANANARVRTRPADRGNRGEARGSATVRTRPSDQGNRGEARGNATVRTRPADRDDRGNATVRVRGEARGDAAVRTRPSSNARGREASANARTRPAANARGNEASANTRTRPAATARGNTATATTDTRAASMARGNRATARTDTRAASMARGERGGANTTVRTRRPGTASAGTAPRATSRQCRTQVAALPRNGVLVLRGDGLASATKVTIGGQEVPMLDRRDDRVRVRVQGRQNGGRVQMFFGNEEISCGNIRVTGR